MFPNKVEHVDYDFLKTDNYEKWKGTFSNSLGKVLEQVHPSLNAAEEALLYVEELILTLMGKLCGKPSPHTVQDVEERVGKTFPGPIVRWALGEARDATDKTKKKKPVLPVDKIHHMLQKEVFMYKIDTLVTSFIVAIVEYIAADILWLAGNYVKKIGVSAAGDGGFQDISSTDIKTSMNADKALMEMFYQEQVVRREKTAREATLARPLEPSRTPRASLTYEDLVKDLMSDEKHYLRDLHMIIRVFREELTNNILPPHSNDVELIFGNLVEIYELTVTLLGSLEDTVESASETQMPHIGICFEELAEAEEFDVYVRYARNVTTQESREALQNIVDNPELSERLDTAGHGFRLAVKYYLPKLLASPITHAFLYFDYVAMLLKLAPCTEDMESFQQVEGLMRPIQKSLLLALGNGPKIEAASRMASKARRQVALEKTNELAKLIDNWDNKDIVGQCCNEFIREDTLGKVGPGRRVSERRAFLFDGLLLLCKPCPAKQDLKLKERLYIRKLDIIDRPDTEELRNCLELSPRYGTSVVLCCNGAIDKNRWMADLVMLNTKSMLDRTLDSILLDLEKKHPLKLPPPSLYRFAVDDSPDNIVLEERQNSGVPLIKGATLLKLVERLTYHIYADPAFVRTFLTTYRSFCRPPELLDLLIERFNIPDPSLVYDAPEKAETVVADTEKLSKNSSREDFKRYRKEFLQPVQFRVLNVLRHWVDQHYYDFERDPSLLDALRTFLASITGKPMKKWVESVIKIVQRKSGCLDQAKMGSPPGAGGEGADAGPPPPAPAPAPVFDRVPPPLEWQTRRPERRGWHILALHPIEVARQLTLLEFDMYRTVKPSELVGAVWTKKDKETSSPNLLRIIKHTNNFTRWIEKSIVEAENLEERTAVLCRALEVMMVLRELNNFNGILAVVSAMASASVFRLKFTFPMLPARLERALEECRELNSDHFRRYQEKLRSINPPCVPFCGMYLTNILHIEDGNKDFLPNSELINFSKRRKVAEITGEIQQYQNQPYCLTVEPRLRGFLETLDPFPGRDDNEIRDYLYSKSLEIEPRHARQAPRFPRKWPELSLKSPGIKPARARHGQISTNSAPATGTVSGDSAGDDQSSTSQLSPTASVWDGGSVASFGSMASLQQQDDELSPRPRNRPQNRHSSMSSMCTFIPESTSPRLPSTCITELSSRMLDNFSNAPPPVSPRPLSTLPRAPLVSPRLQNPATTAPNKGSNDAGAMSLAREQTPPPPPRSFPSPDHQMVEFRNPNGPKWPTWVSDSTFLNDSLPPRLQNMSCEEKHHKIVNDIISNAGGSTDPAQRTHKPPALSPRNPIVDANSFYGTNNSVWHVFESAYKKQMKSNGDCLNNTSDGDVRMGGKPPAISPRNCINRMSNDETAARNNFNMEVDRTTKPTLLPNSRTNGELSSVSEGDSEDPPLILPRLRGLSCSTVESIISSKEPIYSGMNTVSSTSSSITSNLSSIAIASTNVTNSNVTVLSSATSSSVICLSNSGMVCAGDSWSNEEDQPPTPPERPPALSPRGNVYGNSGLTKQGSVDGEDSSTSTHSQSPKVCPSDVFGNFGRFMETSPKLLPTQVSNELYHQPPLSPHVNVPNSVQNYERHHGVTVSTAAFSFPSRPAVSPSWQGCLTTPRPSPTMTQSLGPVPHTPPPLPPRRRRDSTPLAPQPSPTTSQIQGVPLPPPRGGGSPPPLPPRPAQPPAALLRPHHSAILQRRNHTANNNNNNFPLSEGGETPRLPPKPPPTTVFLSPSVTHATHENQ